MRLKSPWHGAMLLLVLIVSPSCAHERLWESYRESGEKEYQEGRFAEAEKMFLAALHEAEKFGPEDPRLARTLNNLAFLYVTQDQYAEAEPLLKRALAIRQQALGTEPAEVATSLNNLAALYGAQGEFEKAEPLYQQAIRILETAQGPDRLDLATAMSNLALLYEAREDYGKADVLYQEALTVMEKVLGPDHPDVATALVGYADLLRKTHRHAAAAAAEARAEAIRTKAEESAPKP